MLTLRSRKKDQTRRTLLEVADLLFREKRYEDATLDEICQRAGVSLRTFFRYFGSKHDLALYENIRNLDRLRAMLADPPHDGGLLDHLEALYATFGEEFDSDAARRHRMRLMAAEPSLAARSMLLDIDTERRIADAFQAAWGDGERMRARLLASMVVGGVRGALVEGIAHADGEPMRDRIRSLFRLIRAAQVAPESASQSQFA